MGRSVQADGVLMKYGSLFSGIGGFDLALTRAGFVPVWMCEIDKNCQNVLQRRFDGVKIYDDVRSIGKNNAESVDLVCGGFPCQDLSVAGKRAGLAGERSGLWFEFARVIDELEPKWVVIENVPGLLSSNKGKDFAVIVQWLAERGYGVSWRILDAQYFGVPQRRRRVFIVGSLGNGRSAEVLFERESLPGDTAPSREKGEGTPSATLRGFGHGWQGQHNDTNAVISRPIRSQSQMAHREDVDTLIVFDANRDGLTNDENISPTLKHQGDGNKAHGAYAKLSIAWEMQHASEAYRESGDTAPTLQQRMGTGGNNVPLVGVRRLTPTECERLQGFPDGWTEGQSDSTRYRQLGNAVAVPVVEWIARRIMEADK